ncbi:MAG TPA: glycosyltransferase family 2 protein [Opitutaceae bacterium]
MPAPLISVLIPSYNRPELLVPTIESVLAQSHCDFEVIVSDDASPRGAEIAAALSRFSADARFRLILQPKNLGWSDNRNALLAQATGEFVMLVGDDDLLPANALARLSRHISSQPDTELIAFGYEVIDLDGRFTYKRHVPTMLQLKVGQGDAWREVFFYDVLPMQAFHPFTLCCRRLRALEWRYDKRCGIGDDVLFLFQALDAGCCIDVLPDVLFMWRRALKPIRGYINLSSNSAANDTARRAIWTLVQQLPWRHPAVHELVHSEEFARHFLGLPRGISREVAELGRIGTPVALADARSCWEKLPPDRRWQAGKMNKLERMRRLGGFGYVWQSCVAAVRRMAGGLTLRTS